MEGRHHCFLLDIPSPLLSEILKIIPPHDLFKISLCNSTLHTLTLEPTIWRHHLLNYWGQESAAVGEEAALSEAVECKKVDSSRRSHIPGNLQEQSDGNSCHAVIGINHKEISSQASFLASFEAMVAENVGTSENFPLLVFTKRAKFLSTLRRSCLLWPDTPCLRSAIDEAQRNLKPLLEGCLELMLLKEVSSTQKVASILADQIDILASLTRLNRSIVQAISDLANRDAGKWDYNVQSLRGRRSFMVRSSHSNSTLPEVQLGENARNSDASHAAGSPMEACLLLYSLSCRLLSVFLKRDPLLCATRLKRTMGNIDVTSESNRRSGLSLVVVEDGYPLQGFPPQSLGGLLVQDLESVGYSKYGRPDIARSLSKEASNVLPPLYLLPAASHSAQALDVSLLGGGGAIQGRRRGPLRDWSDKEWQDPTNQEVNRRWRGAVSSWGLTKDVRRDQLEIGRFTEILCGLWEGFYMYDRQGENGAPDPPMRVKIEQCTPVWIDLHGALMIDRINESVPIGSRDLPEVVLEEFVGISIKGSGCDGVGPFLIDGTLRPSGKQSKFDAWFDVKFCKTYIGRENEFSWIYFGFMDAMGMYGLWGQDSYSWSGSWYLTPVAC